MARQISPFALMLTSISSIIGSGWLFAGFYSSQIAGPSALLSWIISGLAVTIVAFVFGEVCSTLPITGSSTRIPQFTHGTVVSFIFAWIIWLTYVSSVPIEVQAVIQYLTFYFPSLAHNTGALTCSGYIVATVLMLLISIINVISIRWLIKCNNFLTFIKIAVPIFASVVIIALFFTPKRLINAGGSNFMPYGWQGVLAAITSGGIVFAFNGFKQAAEIAGDAKNPRFALPFAIVGSILVCLVIFVLLQIAFLVSIEPHNIIGGWKALKLSSNTSISPLAEIIAQDGIKLGLFPLIYLTAIIAPLASGMMCCSAASRSLFGMSKNGYMPPILQKVSPDGNPIIAIITCFLFGMLLFAPLPGWSGMVTFLSSLMAITYSIGPVSLIALRRQIKNVHHKVFRLPFGDIWATIAFYICTLLAYWTGWKIMAKFGIAMLLGVIVLGAYQIRARHKKTAFHWENAYWIWLYFGGLIGFSYLGSFGGGLNIIPFGWDFLILGVFSLAILLLAVKSRLPYEQAHEYLSKLEEELI
jgi:amino acid transporter